MARPTITAEQRDVLYQHILVRLTGLNDINLAIDKGDFQAANRLCDEFADYLRLLHDDLGWGETTQGGVEIKAPAEVVRRALLQVKGRAEDEDRLEADESAELEAGRRRSRLVRETCSRVLAELDG
jgi:hypothetical protein